MGKRRQAKGRGRGEAIRVLRKTAQGVGVASAAEARDLLLDIPLADRRWLLATLEQTPRDQIQQRLLAGTEQKLRVMPSYGARLKDLVWRVEGGDGGIELLTLAGTALETIVRMYGGICREVQAVIGELEIWIEEDVPAELLWELVRDGIAGVEHDGAGTTLDIGLAELHLGRSAGRFTVLASDWQWPLPDEFVPVLAERATWLLTARERERAHGLTS